MDPMGLKNSGQTNYWTWICRGLLRGNFLTINWQFLHWNMKRYFEKWNIFTWRYGGEWANCPIIPKTEFVGLFVAGIPLLKVTNYVKGDFAGFYSTISDWNMDLLWKWSIPPARGSGDTQISCQSRGWYSDHSHMLGHLERIFWEDCTSSPFYVNFQATGPKLPVIV